MKAKTVNEVLRSDDEYANREIDKWHMEKENEKVQPLKEYIDNVVKLIWDELPENIIKYSGLSKLIVEDLITGETARLDLPANKDLYDYYDNDDTPENAALALGEAIQKYLIELIAGPEGEPGEEGKEF